MDGSIRARMEADLKDAMRSGDQTVRDTLRFALAALKNAQIDQRVVAREQDQENEGEEWIEDAEVPIRRDEPLSHHEELAVLRRQVKQRRESIHMFRQGGRRDLLDREEAQLRVLDAYLPPPLTNDQLTQLVQTAIAEVGASGMKDMKKVMPLVRERAGEDADGRQLAELIRTALTAGGT